MSSFLTIPRELRDRIIQIILTTPRPAPSNADDKGERRGFESIKYKSWSGTSNNFYEPLTNRIMLIPLLLVNRQLHVETLSAIDRLPSKHSYIADIMLVKDKELWVTWLSIPELSPSIDHVYATIRTVGVGDDGHNAFYGTDGGPPLIEWYFYSLLERLLKAGPVGKVQASRSVRLLELNVLTPNVRKNLIAPLGSGAFGVQRLRRVTGIPYYVRPEDIIQEICIGIDCLLQMDRDTAAYGFLLYESLGTIRVFHDGSLQKEWNIGECFKNVEFNNSFGNHEAENREAVFNKWKRRTRRVRVGLGLPVCEYDDCWEHRA